MTNDEESLQSTMENALPLANRSQMYKICGNTQNLRHIYLSKSRERISLHYQICFKMTMKNFLLTTFLAAASLASAIALPISTPNVASFSNTSASLPLEQPATLHNHPEQIVVHTGYRLSFNRETLCPNWVAWELTANETEGSVQRSNDFRPDEMLPYRYQVTTDDYKHSGYDRGHMCPSADMKWSSTAQSECFFMSNICPQTHALNAGGWEKVERACRRWAKREGKVYIVCGPIFNDARKQLYIGKSVKIRVPNAFFKVVLSLKKGEEKAIGFYFTNRDGKQNMGDATKSVDEIEKITGMDFFPQLNDALERRVEAQNNLSLWH